MEQVDPYASGVYDVVMGTGAVGRQWDRIHRAMERPYKGRHFHQILEVGAGAGEHLRHVSSSFDKYVMTDIREERLPKASNLPESVSTRTEDVQRMSFADNEFDRIVVTCVLAHVQDPVLALEEIDRVLAPSGVACIYLPCEPSLALRTARALSTIPKNRRLGVRDPYFNHFREHVHYFAALNHYLRREFSGRKILTRSFPLPVAPWNMSLYRIYWIGPEPR